jgi:acyl-coenzyme A thioesterase PaaI-like protein
VSATVPFADSTWVPACEPLTDPGDVAAYGDLLTALRGVQDALVNAEPDRATMHELTGILAIVGDRLRSSASAGPAPFARQLELPDRGQTLVPPVTIERISADRVEATVRFTPYFHLGGHVAHGGAVALVFDEMLGLLCSAAGRPWSRTAFLHVDYRSPTPGDVPLDLVVWLHSEDGRKRVMRGEIRHGDVVCAEAHGLFVAVRTP